MIVSKVRNVADISSIIYYLSVLNSCIYINNTFVLTCRSGSVGENCFLFPVLVLDTSIVSRAGKEIHPLCTLGLLLH